MLHLLQVIVEGQVSCQSILIENKGIALLKNIASKMLHKAVVKVLERATGVLLALVQVDSGSSGNTGGVGRGRIVLGGDNTVIPLLTTILGNLIHNASAAGELNLPGMEVHNAVRNSLFLCKEVLLIATSSATASTNPAVPPAISLMYTAALTSTLHYYLDLYNASLTPASTPKQKSSKSNHNTGDLKVMSIDMLELVLEVLVTSST